MLLQDGHLLDSKSQKFAFRRAIIVQDELEGQEGRSFLFEINNVRIFCGGTHHMTSGLQHVCSLPACRVKLDPCRFVLDQVWVNTSRVAVLLI